MFAPERYAELRRCGHLHERPLFSAQRSPGELELQARWFAGNFGRRFTSVTGEEIEIVQFGTWNREAGPDFSDAVVRCNGNAPARGSIEFDLTDRNWETHEHATNPAFEETVLHVFVHASERAFFTRTVSHRNVPQVRVDLATLPESFSANVPLAQPGRCQAPLKDEAAPRVLGILEAAAQFRLQRKAKRLRKIIEAHDRETALFQEIAGALGYKQNKLPFTLLAQRLPLKLLHARAKETEALLFGVAGFLQTPDLAAFPEDTRSHLRTLWDCWWKSADEMRRLVLLPDAWELSGARPLNHPQRRLAALAVLVQEWPAFLKSLGNGDAAAIRAFFVSLRHPFWNHHYTLASAATPAPMALIGDSRAADILANVIFPLFAAEGREVWPDYALLPAQLSNRRLETGAARLFADDPRRADFLRTVARQQGLLQIYEDFCLPDNSDCAHCPFPEQMQKWR